MSLTDDQIIHLGDGSLGLNEILEVEKLAVSVQCQQGSMHKSCLNIQACFVVVVQLLTCVRLFATP